MGMSLMLCTLQVEQCKQQMLARIADQKADCEMVRHKPNDCSHLVSAVLRVHGTCMLVCFAV